MVRSLQDTSTMKLASGDIAMTLFDVISYLFSSALMLVETFKFGALSSFRSDNLFWKLSILKSFLRSTVYQHFCSGESVSSLANVSNQLKESYNIGTIADHSTEAVNCRESRSEKLNYFYNQFTELQGLCSFIPIKCSSIFPVTLLTTSSNLLKQQQTSVTNIDHLITLLNDSDKLEFKDIIFKLSAVCEVSYIDKYYSKDIIKYVIYTY